VDRPTKADIDAYYSVAERYYSTLHQDMLVCIEYERLEYQKRLTGLLDGVVAKLPPTAPRAVETLVDHVLLGDLPEITVMFPPNTHKRTDKDEEHREKVQGFLDGAIQQLNRKSVESPLRDSVSQTANPGMGVVSYSINWDKWPDESVKKAGETRTAWDKRRREWERDAAMAFPFDVRSVNPVNIYVDPAHDPPEWVIEVRQRKYTECEDRTPGIRNTKPSETAMNRASWKGAPIEVEEKIFVSKQWYGCWHNDIPYLTEEDGADADGIAPNPEGIIWYERATAGKGKNDYENRPEFKIRGILRDAWGVLDVEAEAFNQVNAIRNNQAYGSWDITDQDGTADTAKQKIAKNPINIAGYTFRDPSLIIKGLELPPLDASVFTTLELISNYLDLALGAAILRGIGTTGDAAAKYRTMLAEARLQFQATRESCQQMWEGVLMGMLEMIKKNAERFKRGISVYGSISGQDQFLTLKPPEIPDGLIVKVKFNPTTAEERAFKMEQGLQLLQAGPGGTPAIDFDTFLSEYAGVKNVQEVKRKLRKDRIMNALTAFAEQTAVQMMQQEMAQRMPGLFPLPAPEVTASTNGNTNEIPEAAPGGFTQPGEQPVAPATGTPQDMLSQMGSGLQPQLAGVR
jgi:hypothetical protein